MKRLPLLAVLALLSGSVVPPPPAITVIPVQPAAMCAGSACVQEDVKEAKQADGISTGGGYFDSRSPLRSGPVIGLAAGTAAGSVAVPGSDSGLPIAAPSDGIGSVLIGGVISYVGPRFGPSYLALPFPRGTVAQVCGPLGCVTRRSTDFGPDQRVHPNRIADVSAADFTAICGPLSIGLCRGSVEIEPPVAPEDDEMREEDGGPKPTVPPTDSQEGAPE